jgi:ABC-type Zn uptake system ZnuABC Zn-binding protein ZnuA
MKKKVQARMSRRTSKAVFIGALILVLASSACAPEGGASPTSQGTPPKVLAVESFLADIAQNVAGDRLTVGTLIPVGVDPHTFEPTPRDVARIADSNVLIVNGGGLETWLERVLANAGGQRLVITASQGLKSRTSRPGEPPIDEGGQVDPHFWMDPLDVIMYVDNIRDGLSQADPAGAQDYARNADTYIEKLKELDAWISDQVAQVPAQQRKLVTNHEDFGYFADRYGFQIVGTVIPSVSSLASPSAQQVAQLVDAVKASGVKAIFVETGANTQLAEQVAQEAGVKLVSDLYTHTLTGPNGPAPTYIDMMKYDTNQIVSALK